MLRWFKKAIADHGDCYYGDGACVGACARLYLASIYAKQGKASEAEKLKGEIRTQFPDAVTHKEKWGQALRSYPEMSPRTRALLTASARVEASRARKIFLRLSFTVS